MAAKIWKPGKWEIPLYSAHNIRLFTQNECQIYASDYNKGTDGICQWVEKDSPKWEVFRACRVARQKDATVKRIFIVPNTLLADNRLGLVLAAQFVAKFDVRALGQSEFSALPYVEGAALDFSMILGPKPDRRLIKGVSWEPSTPNHKLLFPEHKQEYYDIFKKIWGERVARTYEQLLEVVKAQSPGKDFGEVIREWRTKLSELFGNDERDQMTIWENTTSKILLSTAQ